jgi:hypothetical protein
VEENNVRAGDHGSAGQPGENVHIVILPAGYRFAAGEITTSQSRRQKPSP